MLLKIRFLTKVINLNTTTYYFLNKDLNILLPIEIENRKNTFTNVYLRTLKTIDIKLKGIKIYLYLEDTYYVYLTILDKKIDFDINIRLEDSLSILDNYDDILELTMEKDILLQEGITITKEMVESWI